MSAPDDEAPRSISEDLVPAVDELVKAVLGVGVAITRSVARAADPTEPGSPLAGGSVEQIVRNGVAAITDLVLMTTNGVRNRQGARPAGTAGSSAAGSAGAGSAANGTAPGGHSRSGRPAVQAGTMLRMPLFIENPTGEPTGPLTFAVGSTRGPAASGGVGLEFDHIHCEPATLEIAGHDFEKLTVFVRTSATTPLGTHSVSVGVPGTVFQTTVEFDVVEPQ
jgi:hypothetical protein